MDIKNYNDFINESKKIDAIPEIGKKVLCCDGAKYKIIAYDYHDPDSNVNMDFFRKYDSSGAMLDAHRTRDIDSEILVALESLDDETYSVWQWDPSWIEKYI